MSWLEAGSSDDENSKPESSIVGKEKVEEEEDNEWEKSDSEPEVEKIEKSSESPPVTESKPGEKETSSQKQKSEPQKKTEKSGEAPLRSPIVVIMGHVDTGKTKLLDKIRHTNVQDNEAGGITQQIGATYFPVDILKKLTSKLADKKGVIYKLPGFLIIDTPGHESFSNLRSRGSSLCDVAILVVDIMHGIEKQTIESIQMLKNKKTPFVIALNKIDRLSDWKAKPNASLADTMRQQTNFAKQHFDKLFSGIKNEFMKLSLNIELYSKLQFGQNDKLTAIPVIPTSAITGEGIPDLLFIIMIMTQNKISSKLISKEELQCTVLEVKVEDGIGTTLDVILANGVLRVGDKIVLAGLSGPVVTKIRALLTPQPLKELRIKGQWVHHDEIYAAMGCKIAAPDLNGAIAGSELFVAENDDEIEELEEKVQSDIDSVLTSVDKSEKGLLVHASTLGSLEAFLIHLKGENVPVSVVGIGPVYRKDILPIVQNSQTNPEIAVVLAFDVEIHPEAQKIAAENKITVFQAPIIYHLTDSYSQYVKDLKTAAKEQAKTKIYFPVKFELLPKGIFHRTKPIIIGVKILAGTLYKGIPVITSKTDKPLNIGTIESIEINKQSVEKANVGDEVAINIKPPNDWTPVAEQDFKAGEVFYPRLNRQIIDLLKEHFRDELKSTDWNIVREIKALLNIK